MTEHQVSRDTAGEEPADAAVTVRDSAAASPEPSAATSDGWTPELRRLEREYDEARHAAHAAHDGFEEGLIRATQGAWERFSEAVRNG